MLLIKTLSRSNCHDQGSFVHFSGVTPIAVEVSSLVGARHGLSAARPTQTRPVLDRMVQWRHGG
jgi:hypothetical protein